MILVNQMKQKQNISEGLKQTTKSKMTNKGQEENERYHIGLMMMMI